jgi:hypothetical protein
VIFGYLEDMGFDSSNGTMFRLPFRNECMARDSELSDQDITHETTDRLFAKFRPDTFNCLLFLNSVRSIQLSEVDERTGKVVISHGGGGGHLVPRGVRTTQEAHDNFVRCLRKPSTREVVYRVRLSDN